MHVAKREYLKAKFIAFLFLVLMLTVFLILGIIYASVIETLIIIGSIMVLVLAHFLYEIPLFSKYYIEDQYVILQCGRLYNKKIGIVDAKTRTVELMMTIGAIPKQEFKATYIIVAEHDVDIDKVLHYTENDLLKCLREKGIIAIPEFASNLLFNR